MVNSFLFGNQSSSQSKYLFEFKAGKMEMTGTTVKPINKKGLVYLHKTDDNLMHFCWKDRTSGNVTDDLIIFPDDTEFKKVSQCTTGRVFVLKFKTSKKVYFYWLQESSEDKDDEICKKVNDLLNNPSASTSRNSSQSITDLSESEIHNIINNVGSSQLMQILSGNRVGVSQVLQNLLNQSNTSSRMSRHSNSSSRSSGTKASNNNQESSSASSNQTTASSTTTNSTTQQSSANTPIAQTTTAAGVTAGAGIQLSDLQNIISGLTVDQQQAKKEIVNVDLSSIVNSDALKNLLGNKEFMDKVKELLPDTNEVDKQQTLSEQVISTIDSVQFKSALSSFSSALQSGLLGPLVQQFNLSESCVDAANKGDLEAFVKAMESSSVKKSTTTDKKTETGDSDMALE